MSRYLVTGGAGFLGTNLVQFLVSKGHSITSLDIAGFPSGTTHPAIRAIQGDIRDRVMVDRAMDGADIVVHAAAALPRYKKRDILTTDIDGTKNVLESAFQHHVDRVVVISSTMVYGVPDKNPILENDRLEAAGTYGQAKVAAEVLCGEFRKKDMCIPILRPKTFVGAERLGIFALLYDWAREGRGFPILGNGRNRYQLLDVEDLCEAILLAATGDRQTVNDTFNIGAKHFATMREDFQAVLDYAGSGKRIRTMPAAPAVMVLRLLELLHLSPIYRWVYESADKDSFVSIEKAERVLGFKPRYSNREALIRNYQWYRDNRERFRGTSGISHRTLWKQGALGMLKRLF